MLELNVGVVSSNFKGNDPDDANITCIITILFGCRHYLKTKARKAGFNYPMNNGTIKKTNQLFIMQFQKAHS